jgi:hypothetical protein
MTLLAHVDPQLLALACTPSPSPVMWRHLNGHDHDDHDNLVGIAPTPTTDTRHPTWTFSSTIRPRTGNARRHLTDLMIYIMDGAVSCRIVSSYRVVSYRIVSYRVAVCSAPSAPHLHPPTGMSTSPTAPSGLRLGLPCSQPAQAGGWSGMGNGRHPHIRNIRDIRICSIGLGTGVRS